MSGVSVNEGLNSDNNNNNNNNNREKLKALMNERPYAQQVIQSQLLYDIASMMEDLLERVTKLESIMKKPQGRILPININVEGTKILRFVEEFPFTPLFSLTLFNDGPADVYINTEVLQTVTPLKPYDNFNINMENPVIKELIFVVKQGNAQIRGFGIY
jgi:hypothetical protein